MFLLMFLFRRSMVPKLRCSSEGGWLFLSYPRLMSLPVPHGSLRVTFPCASLLEVEKSLSSLFYQLCQFIRLVLGVRQRLAIPGFFLACLSSVCQPWWAGDSLSAFPFLFMLFVCVDSSRIGASPDCVLVVSRVDMWLGDFGLFLWVGFV